jgi:putative transcriptional regulator
MRVSEAQETLHMDWPDGSDAQLFRGGPCAPSPGEPLGFVLHFPSTPPADSSGEQLQKADELQEGGIVLYTVPPDPESLSRLESEPPGRVRFLVGYSRWGAGQLESELLQGAWLVADADPHIIFETPIDAIWEAAVRSIGIDPESLLPGSLVAGPEIH